MQTSSNADETVVLYSDASINYVCNSGTTWTVLKLNTSLSGRSTSAAGCYVEYTFTGDRVQVFGAQSTSTGVYGCIVDDNPLFTGWWDASSSANIMVPYKGPLSPPCRECTHECSSHKSCNNQACATSQGSGTASTRSSLPIRRTRRAMPSLPASASPRTRRHSRGRTRRSQAQARRTRSRPASRPRSMPLCHKLLAQAKVSWTGRIGTLSFLPSSPSSRSPLLPGSS